MFNKIEKLVRSPVEQIGCASLLPSGAIIFLPLATQSTSCFLHSGK